MYTSQHFQVPTSHRKVGVGTRVRNVEEYTLIICWLVLQLSQDHDFLNSPAAPSQVGCCPQYAGPPKDMSTARSNKEQSSEDPFLSVVSELCQVDSAKKYRYIVSHCHCVVGHVHCVSLSLCCGTGTLCLLVTLL